MLLVHLLSWWYSRGWAWIFGRLSERLIAISETFSVGILIRTLFSPWKQIQSPSTFRTFLQSSIDNFISRFVGFVVRIGLLIGAFVAAFLVLILGLILTILWPVLPALVIILPIMALAGAN